MKYSPYRFRCFFNKMIWCGQFNPKIYRKRGILPNPCRRCRYYIKSPQYNLDSFTAQNLNTLEDGLKTAHIGNPKNTEKRCCTKNTKTEPQERSVEYHSRWSGEHYSYFTPRKLSSDNTVYKGE